MNNQKWPESVIWQRHSRWGWAHWDIQHPTLVDHSAYITLPYYIRPFQELVLLKLDRIGLWFIPSMRPRIEILSSQLLSQASNNYFLIVLWSTIGKLSNFATYDKNYIYMHFIYYITILLQFSMRSLVSL